jgi:uncharacterized Zn finger protein
MVHFSAQVGAPLFRTPPVCPKCGSHRTEIIGERDLPPKRVLRCNTCGAISTVSHEDAAVVTGAPSAA